MNHLTQLEWRYATKHMNGNKIPQEKLNSILQAIRLTPTSYGLQPFSVLVINDQETRKKMQGACYNQPQITESSTVLVFANWLKTSEKEVDEYLKQISEERQISLESLAEYKKMILGTLSAPEEKIKTWAAKQTYIALGFGLYAAALENIDATPMEGFEPQKIDEILNLQEKGLQSSVILALGYRDEKNDYLAKAKKIRRPADKFFITI